MNNFKLLKGYTNQPHHVRDERPIQQENRIPVFEPMRSNRFLVTFPQIFNISPYFVRMASRPTNVMHNNVPSWDDMTFVLYDPIVPSLSRTIYELIADESIYCPIVLKLEMLDPTGAVVSNWTIYGRINTIDFSNLDFSNDDVSDITLNMSVSNAILNY